MNRAHSTLWSSLALLLLGATAWLPAAAQTPAASTAAGAPAAKPAAAPAPAAAPVQYCTAPEYRQFDFWVGDWDVRNPDGTPAGVNRVEKNNGGCVVQEHWKGGKGMSGTSFNTFSQQDKKWHQIWVDDQEGFFETAGGIVDGKMVMSGDMVANGQKLLQRWSWTKLSDDKVLQRWEISRDEGKTWKVGFEATYLRKK